MSIKIIISLLFVSLGFVLGFAFKKNNCYIKERPNVIEIDNNTRYQFGQDFTRSIHYFKLLRNQSIGSSQTQILIDSIQTVEDNNLIFLWKEENNYAILYKSGFHSLDEPGYFFTKDSLYSIVLRPISIINVEN